MMFALSLLMAMLLKIKLNVGGGGQGSPQPPTSPPGVKCRVPFPGLPFLSGAGYGGHEVILWSQRSSPGPAGSD